MNEVPARRGILLDLAAEGLVPVLGGCAGVLAGGAEGGLAGVAVGQVVEKAINFFGGHIVQRWCEWFRGQPPQARQAAVADLAAMSPEEAHHHAAAALDRLAPDARPEDKSLALQYLAAIPGTLDRALVRDNATGLRALPPTVSFDEPMQLLELLPTDAPPYPVPCELARTPYVLEQLLGTGGFGAVYRATTRSLQHLPFAIKFCLDPNMIAALHRERSNLERLMKAGGAEGWSPRIVRLYGYDLEHRTPYLVYEYVPGGDLTHHLAQLRQEMGRSLNADEILGLMVQVVEGLAFAHQHGLVHRDLKPANVLVGGGSLKLADFGLGAVTAVRAARVSRIGVTTVDFLTVAERASLFRGAGTPLYMSPEQRRGAAPDPRQDLFSLGVMWFQLLAGDVTRELHPGWAKELAVRFGVPPAHLDVIGRCVGWVEERPRDAVELLPLLQALRTGDAPASAKKRTTAPTASPAVEPATRLRQALLTSLVRQIDHGHVESARLTGWGWPVGIGVVTAATLLYASASIATVVGEKEGAGFGLAVALIGVVLSLILAGIVGSLVSRLRSQRRQMVQQQLETSLTTLGTEFPDAVHQWGGPAVLRSPMTVTEIVRRLEGETAPPGGPAPMRPGEEQRGFPVEKLRALAAAHARAAWYGERRSLPWWLALLLSAAVLGIPTGSIAASLFANDQQAIGGASSLQPPQPYMDSRGRTISELDYTLQMQRLPYQAGLVGAGVGLAVTVVATIVLSWWRFYRWALVVGLVGSAALVGAPAGSAVGNVYYGYHAPYLSGPFALPYDWRGTQLSRDWATLERRHVETQSVLLAIGVGVVLTLGGTWLFLWRYGRRHTLARQAVVLQAHELATAFPAAVEAWGGAQRLRDRAFVEEALQANEQGR
jgi:hypothetical protein